jgi:hypothetical protein
LGAPYGARKWQIETSHSKQTHQQNAKSANAKQSDSKQINAEQQTAADISESANSSKISKINDNEGRLPAGGTRPRNTHCMIMLPT